MKPNTALEIAETVSYINARLNDVQRQPDNDRALALAVAGLVMTRRRLGELLKELQAEDTVRDAENDER